LYLFPDESYHVCHRGYLSLFPFLLGLLPSSSPHLGPILDLLYDPAHLWSPYGLRSLSASHELFGKDENYWRGPVWIQMNYLALKALFEVCHARLISKDWLTERDQKYAKEDGPYKTKARKIYGELRRNVVDNVFEVTVLDLNASGVARRHRSFSGIPAHRIRLGAVRRHHG
jgi:mannosyl-oligosaccharide glucosidase